MHGTGVLERFSMLLPKRVHKKKSGSVYTCEPGCTGGQVLNTAGNCECRNNTVWVNNQCRPRCTGGKVHNPDGNCECPSDKPEFINNRCRPSCIGGQVHNTEGYCYCPGDTVWKYYRCRQSCTGGKVHNYFGRCKCPSDTELVNNQCLPRCTGGKVRVGTSCQCPSNTELVNNQCLQRCTGGKVRVGNRCLQRCTGGQVRYSDGSCYCPIHIPLRINNRCRPWCTGGRVYNTAGNCECPSGREHYYDNKCPVGQKYLTRVNQCVFKCKSGHASVEKNFLGRTSIYCTGCPYGQYNSAFKVWEFGSGIPAVCKNCPGSVSGLFLFGCFMSNKRHCPACSPVIVRWW